MINDIIRYVLTTAILIMAGVGIFVYIVDNTVIPILKSVKRNRSIRKDGGRVLERAYKSVIEGHDITVNGKKPQLQDVVKCKEFLIAKELGLTVPNGWRYCAEWRNYSFPSGDELVTYQPPPPYDAED